MCIFSSFKFINASKYHLKNLFCVYKMLLHISDHENLEICRDYSTLYTNFVYSSYVALFYIERDCLSKSEIGEREIYMHSKCM